MKNLRASQAAKRRAGLAAIEEWEKENGEFTQEEMDEAYRTVREQLRSEGYPRPHRR